MIDFSCQDRTDELCGETREFIEKTMIAIVGMGALGTNAAHALVRSGAKRLLLIDDDTVEASNLPRQSLYGQADIGKEKIAVAKERLLAISDDVDIEMSATRIDEKNVSLLADAELVLDCVDNLETRNIIDAYCFEQEKPWVHAAVVKAQGEVMAVVPGKKRYSEVIKGKHVDLDCAQEGVLSVAAIMTGTFQATMALRVLAGKRGEVADKLYRLDCWQGRIDRFDL